MSYVGNIPTTAAFPFDQFSGNGSTTAFTLSYAPAGATSIIVSISGVVQNPNTYSVSGTTLTFTPAPPTGTSNIAVLYLGLPVVATLTPGNTAYFSSSVFTATASQTVFTPSGTYQVGFINVIRNGSQLAPADYTATDGTTVTLASPCTAGDTVVIEVFNLTSLTGALPLTGGTVTGASAFDSTLSVNGAYVSGFTGFKNRIINGRMEIDQRNNGASVSNNGSQSYNLDRWQTGAYGGGVLQTQRSTIAPAGFTNSLAITVTTADASVAAGDLYFVSQSIEGLNCADLAWGTVSAATVTVSFWVRSSLTGTFSGSLKNSAGNRSYPFTYAISAANTWEQKTVTIAGDTSGTWLTTNGIGITACFDLGSGTDYTGTAGAWAAENNFGADGAVKLISTLNATWQITGVQLERGSNATSFEFRDYGRELILCQRYFQKFTGSQLVLFGYWDGTNSAVLSMPYPVTPRTSPTGLAVSSASHFLVNNSTVGNPTASAIIFNSASLYAMQLEAQVASGGSSNGKACRLISASSSASIEITGFEL